MDTNTNAAREPKPIASVTPGSLDRLREEVSRTRDRLRQEAERRMAERRTAATTSLDPAAPAKVVSFDSVASARPPAPDAPGQGTTAVPVTALLDRVREAFAPQPQSSPAKTTDALDAPVAIAVELSCIREDLGRLRPGDGGEALADAMAALGRKIDILNAKAVDPTALERLEAQTADLKAAVSRALAGRIPDAPAPVATEIMAAFQAKAEAAAERIEAVFREAPAPVLEARLDDIAAQISGLAQQRAESQHLPMAIEGGAAALAPLVNVIEHHLVALTERVVASEERLSDLGRLDGIEDCLIHLVREMEHLRRAVGEASVESMQAVALRLSARDDAPSVVGLKRGLAVLEARQRDFELRAEETLMRGLELELQDLIEVTPVSDAAPRRATADAFDADRRLFDQASAATPARGEHAGHWQPRAARATPAAPGPRTRRFSAQAAGRAAVIAAALVLAGLTALQAMGPSGAGSNGAMQTALPLPAVDPLSLPAPVGPAALREAAIAGDAAAAYEVGMRYDEGRGTPADRAAAMKWLGFAVAKGSAPAALRLGAIEENGLRNRSEAARLYDWAAGRGNVRAMHNLGVLASEGAGGTADWAVATRWFEQAAERGLSDSQHNLGIIYSRGFNGSPDLGAAWKWFALAAGQGDTDSARKRDALTARMDADTATRAKAAAAAFVPKAQDADANQVALRPEWEAPEPQRSAAMPGPVVQ